MNKWLQQYLKSQRNCLILRMVFWGVLLICVGILLFAFLRLNTINKKELTLNELFTIRNTISQLKLNVSDSLVLKQVSSDKQSGILQGWEEAALWIEHIAFLAANAGIEIEYIIDSLETIPQGGTEVYLMPLHIGILANDAGFGATMQFIENISADTTVTMIYGNLEMLGSDEGLKRTELLLKRWIRI